MKSTWRWFGPADPVALDAPTQAGATGIVTSLHELADGDAWSKDQVAKRGKAGEALEKEVTSVKTGRTLDEIAAKSSKVWHSNRSVDENVKAGAVAKPAKKTAKKAVKKKTSKKTKAPRKRVTRSKARR